MKFVELDFFVEEAKGSQSKNVMLMLKKNNLMLCRPIEESDSWDPQKLPAI